VAVLCAAAALLGCGSTQRSPSASPGRPRTATFSGLAGDPVRGTVIVTAAARGYTLRVEASGLVPGRDYALHLHEGRCVGPDTVRSRHDLPALRADAGGRGTVTATVTGGPPAGPGTVLHVHGSTQAGSTDYRRVQCTSLPG
jgi:hypothetical protein